MASQRRSSAFNIPPLADPAVHRRSSSWSYTSEEMQLDGGSSHGLDGQDELAELLTNQRWHEVGNGPHPICASSDFDVMVDQISSILSVRLRDLLVAKTRTLLGGGDPLDPIFHRPPASFSSYSSHASIENGVKNNNIKNIVLIKHIRFHSNHILIFNIVSLVTVLRKWFFLNLLMP